MERENKYLVAKWADIEAFLTDEQQLKLSALMTRIEVHRLQGGKQPQHYVVTAADWPMYEDVWKLIEGFVDTGEYASPFNELAALRKEAEELREQTCNCRFVDGVNIQQCTLHNAWAETLTEQATYRRERDSLAEQLAAAKLDAERYRKLQCFSGQAYEYSARYQQVGKLNDFIDATFIPPEMYADTAIDSAMQEKK